MFFLLIAINEYLVDGEIFVLEATFAPDADELRIYVLAAKVELVAHAHRIILVFFTCVTNSKGRDFFVGFTSNLVFSGDCGSSILRCCGAEKPEAYVVVPVAGIVAVALRRATVVRIVVPTPATVDTR